MKNDSWLFPFEMPLDDIFDSNHDGKLTGFETLMRDSVIMHDYELYLEDEKKKQSSSYEPPKYYSPLGNKTAKIDDSWFHDSYTDQSDALNTEADEIDENEEDLSDTELDFESDAFDDDFWDLDSEMDILDDDIPELENTEIEENQISIPLTVNFTVEFQPKSNNVEIEKDIKPEDFPNKRRYNAASTLANKYIIYSNDDLERKEKGRCRFILDKADTILAANYLSPDGGFLYAQAIKDNFELPCHLPDEDEKPEMELYEIIVKIARNDIILALRVWKWCMEMFGPYTEYDEFSAYHLSGEIINNIYDFSDHERVMGEIISDMQEDPVFCKKVIDLSEEYDYNSPYFIATALFEERYQVAQIMFKSELNKLSGDWKKTISFVDSVLRHCSDGKQVEAMEYFRDNFFSYIRKLPSEMVQDEIPEFEKKIANYISKTEDTSEKYAYSRKNAWRKSVPDGKEYCVDPLYYSNEKEYVDALNKAKYGWRESFRTVEKEYGLNAEDYETVDEFREAMNAVRLRRLEEKEEATRQKRFLQQTQTLSDKTIYTYYDVLLPNVTTIYHYRSDDPTIKIGDTVIVPVGYSNTPTEGTVVSIGQYLRVGAPYPVERTKKIISKKND